MTIVANLARYILGAAVALALACLSAHADDLDDFNRAVEAAMSHHRVASDALRADKIDLAALEIENLREAWGKVSALRRPAAFRDAEHYNAMMLETAAALIGTTLVLNMGRADVARDSLDKMRRQLSQLRRESGVPVLADCVLDANIAMEALFALDGRADWDSAAAGAESYQATLRRCDKMAPASTRNHADFRRLIDGALASLAELGKAAEAHDRERLHGLLIELRALDRLLALHYG